VWKKKFSLFTLRVWHRSEGNEESKAELLYAFFWVNLRGLNFIWWRFETLCLFHRHRQVSLKNELGLRNIGVFILLDTQHFSDLVHSSNLPAYEDGTDCFETSAYKFQTRGIAQKKAYNIQNTTKVWNQERQNSHDGLSSRGQEYLLYSKFFVICIGN
jgi:hypothetical protein